MRLRLLVSEAWRSLGANISTTFAATMTVLIGMCLLGLFIALGTWVLSWSSHVQKELQVHVYFAGNATPQQEHAVFTKLSSDPRAPLRAADYHAAAPPGVDGDDCTRGAIADV